MPTRRSNQKRGERGVGGGKWGQMETQALHHGEVGPSPLTTHILWLGFPPAWAGCLAHPLHYGAPLTGAPCPAAHLHSPGALGPRDHYLSLTPPPRENRTRRGLGVTGRGPPTSDLHADAALNAIGHKLELSTVQAGRHRADSDSVSGAISANHVHVAGLQGLPIQEPLARRSHSEVHREGHFTALHCLHCLQRCLHSQLRDCRWGLQEEAGPLPSLLLPLKPRPKCLLLQEAHQKVHGNHETIQGSGVSGGKLEPPEIPSKSQKPGSDGAAVSPGPLGLVDTNRFLGAQVLSQGPFPQRRLQQYQGPGPFQ